MLIVGLVLVSFVVGLAIGAFADLVLLHLSDVILGADPMHKSDSFFDSEDKIG